MKKMSTLTFVEIFIDDGIFEDINKKLWKCEAQGDTMHLVSIGPKETAGEEYGDYSGDYYPDTYDRGEDADQIITKIEKISNKWQITTENNTYNISNDGENKTLEDYMNKVSIYVINPPNIWDSDYCTDDYRIPLRF